VRKAIAKVLTVINEKRRNQAREDTKKGRTPYDLRYKKTRAFRRKLTKKELSLRTLRQQKKQDNFSQRKFALAA
jgi:large subunit ribosomal protein L35e